MAGPATAVPYNDPHDIPLEYLNYLHDDPGPSLANLSSLIQQPNNPTTNHPTDLTNIKDCLGPMDDPLVLNILHQWVNEDGFSGDVGAGDNLVGDVGTGPSNYNINNHEQQPCSGEASNATRGGSGGHGNYDYLDAGWRPVEVWPPDPAAFGCTCCLVLRELLHFDGTCTTKLEIHGRLGIICHAILEIRDHHKPVPEHYMFDFCKKSIENVGQFLREYHNDRLKAGFALVQDPLSVFYQALCVGLEWDTRFMDNGGSYGSSLTNSGLPGEQQNGNMGEEQKEVRIGHTDGENSKETETRSALAKQRERAGRLTLKDFGEYFHLPIEEAAKRMNLCPTVVKKICRRDGMPRWPHRKLKSLQRQISNLKESLSSSSGQQRASAETEIRRLEKEIADLCGAAYR